MIVSRSAHGHVSGAFATKAKQPVRYALITAAPYRGPPPPTPKSSRRSNSDSQSGTAVLEADSGPSWPRKIALTIVPESAAAVSACRIHGGSVKMMMANARADDEEEDAENSRATVASVATAVATAVAAAAGLELLRPLWGVVADAVTVTGVVTAAA